MGKVRCSKFAVVDEGHYSNELLMDLIAKHHDHLCEAKIALVWRFDWKADDDGRIQLGQAKKVTDLDKQFHAFDFMILLNYEICTSADWTEERMAALLDHELCHCGIKLDENGEAVRDEHGNPVYRMRKHDVEEFSCIIERHGLWKGDLEKVGEIIAARNKSPLLAVADGTAAELKQAC